ncbi:MAG: DUF1003 domain-containing protein [Thermomicrobiales bacterium]
MGDDPGTVHHETETRWHALSEPERRAIRRMLAHRHHAENANIVADEHLTPGERVADAVARLIGSWPFIIAQSIVLFSWIIVNVIGWIRHWDPYPFILLNLALSFQAAYSAPIIMMSQNRQAAKDRLSAELDYRVNLHAEDEVASIRERLDELSGSQWATLVELQEQQLALLTRIEQLTVEVHRLTSAPPPSTDR